MIDILTNESFLALTAIYAIAALGMNVVYVTGQLNLGQAGFFAIGAYSVAVTNAELGTPLAPSLAVAALVAAVVALPVAAVCARLHGIYLVMGTLAIGEIVRVAVGNIDAVGGVEGYSGMLPISNSAIYLTLVVAIAAVVALMASSLGLRMRSVFDDDEAAAAAGVPTRAVKALAVILGAAVVAVAGGLYARALLFIAPEDFGIMLSFSIALYTLVGGVHSVLGALVGAVGISSFLELLKRVEDITWIPSTLDVLGPWRMVVYGLLVMLLMALSPSGLVSRSFALSLLRPLHRLRRSLRGGADAGDVPLHSGEPLPDDVPVLEVRNVTRRFGSVLALDDVSLDVRPGEILALIGANGAGKSTLIDVIAGRYAPDEGTVLLRGEPVERWRPEARARAGLGRTFQSVRVFAHLTADESLRLGRAAARGRLAASVEQIARLTGLEDKRDALSDALTLGEQRRLEIGRAVASAPDVLLLDEPSAGMNDAERAELAELIRTVRSHGIAILLIDHNLDLALALADRVAVLDFGSLITVTGPDEVLADRRVQVAYLGTAEAALA